MSRGRRVRGDRQVDFRVKSAQEVFDQEIWPKLEAADPKTRNEWQDLMSGDTFTPAEKAFIRLWVTVDTSVEPFVP